MFNCLQLQDMGFADVKPLSVTGGMSFQLDRPRCKPQVNIKTRVNRRRYEGTPNCLRTIGWQLEERVLTHILPGAKDWNYLPTVLCRYTYFETSESNDKKSI